MKRSFKAVSCHFRDRLVLQELESLAPVLALLARCNGAIEANLIGQALLTHPRKDALLNFNELLSKQLQRGLQLTTS